MQVKLETIQRINEMGTNKTPFLFVIDFACENAFIQNLNEVDPNEILFAVNEVTNVRSSLAKQKTLQFDTTPVSKEIYHTAFQKVKKHLNYGNTFLLNLTMPSRVETNYSLKEIFQHSKAKYKLWFKDQFVVFSPETFVQTDNQKISSFPMKGTIDADLPDAENQLLHNEKELAEHYTIVDLIRNDLSMVAKNVKVERFRFIDHIKTHRKNLLQMSSKISGDLADGWQNRIGDILFSMLPAGSISGAPKKKTLEIIRDAELYNRDYYTGIFGIFDGENIDSGVMIRFIEKTADGLIYKSGGGITAKSHWEEEYEELIDKIYVPLA